MFPKLPLKVYGAFPSDHFAVAVEQVSTGKLFDFSAGAFSDKPAQPLLLLAPPKAAPGVARTDLPIDPAKMPDGRYAVVYHKDGVPFTEEVVDLWMGEWRPPTSTDLILRLMNAAAGVNPATKKTATVRDAFGKLVTG